MKGRIQCLAGIRTEAHAASQNALFFLWLWNMGQRKDAITPFSTSSAIVGPNSSQGT